MTSEFTIAVHALVYLEYKAEVLSSEQLAANVCTNPARIRKVMAKLKKADMVRTREGIGGGYEFHGDPEKINLWMVAEAVNITFVSVSWKSGDPHQECLVASGMAAVMTEMYENLNQTCYDRLKEITIADVSAKIFAK